ncbi:hypothetical protein NGR_c13230 [Sinorhizobium fredii NGR234]|uniref:Uncharacterized protein n=1 Tax=Sinorhizobium fredii (strain NBRC 101917 / NGR234) TaxID=394 RepID=C3MBP1_SINFN|nr:hypothetical protein NGR_c13230 [Sinorhizobium fredii NGR234]
MSIDRAAFRSQVHVEDCHRETIGKLAVFLVAKYDAKEFIAKVNLRGFVLPGTSLDDHRGIQSALEIGLKLADFFGLQISSPYPVDLRRFSHAALPGVNPHAGAHS